MKRLLFILLCISVASIVTETEAYWRRGYYGPYGYGYGPYGPYGYGYGPGYYGYDPVGGAIAGAGAAAGSILGGIFHGRD